MLNIRIIYLFCNHVARSIGFVNKAELETGEGPLSCLCRAVPRRSCPSSDINSAHTFTRSSRIIFVKLNQSIELIEPSINPFEQLLPGIYHEKYTNKILHLETPRPSHLAPILKRETWKIRRGAKFGEENFERSNGYSVGRVVGRHRTRTLSYFYWFAS